MIDPGTTPGLLSGRDIALGALCGALLLLLVMFSTRTWWDRGLLWDAAGVKLGGAVVFVLCSVFVFRGGDTFFYHAAGMDHSAALRGEDVAPSTYCFDVPPSSTLYLCYLSGYVHLVAGDSFIASTLVFASLGFVGQVLIYRTFVDAYPDSRLRLWWGLGILVLPSLVFWSSGLLKEPLRLLALGATVWGVYAARVQRRPVGFAAGALGFVGLWTFSINLLPAIVIALVPILLAGPAREGQAQPARQRPGEDTPTKSRSARWILLAGALGATIWIAGQLSPEYSLERVPQSIFEQGQLYESVEDARLLAPLMQEATWPGLLRAWPSAIVMTLFRPFPWEITGLADMLAAAENVVLVLLSVRALRNTLSFPQIITRAWRSPLFQTCVLMVLLLGLAIGATTPNFGSLSRYRLPVLPFFIGALGALRWQWQLARESAAVARHAPRHPSPLPVSSAPGIAQLP